MPRVVRTLQLVVRISKPVSITLCSVYVALVLIGRWDLVIALIRATLIVVGVVSAFWLAVVVKTCQDIGAAAKMSLVDISASPLPIPDGLQEMDGEIRRLGFRPLGEMEVHAAWPEKRPRAYVKYASAENPGIVAELSFTARRTAFMSYWANGRAIDTGYPPLAFAVPAGVSLLPPELTAQHSDDGIEAAYRLQLDSVAGRVPADGIPLAVVDMPTALALESRIQRQIATFELAKRRPLIRQAFFIVPAWAILTWIAFSISVRS